MADDPIYHEGTRRLQDARDTRRIADRLTQVTWRTTYSEGNHVFISA